jgi:allantoicase
VELGARGVLRKVEVDTTHFRGNAPGKILLEGLDQAGASVDALTSPKAGWRTLLRLTKAQAHTRHFFEDELRAIGPVTHVRLSVYPCGGIARLRAWGDVAVRTDAAAIAKLNAMPRAEAVSSLLAANGSKAWAEKMADRRPFEDLPALQRAAERTWWDLGEADWLEAFSAHPRIGGSKAAKETGAQGAAWAGQEQAGVAAATDAVKSELATLNADYEKKYGFVYLICATGKSADEMLAILKERMDSTRERELRTAAEEQAMITRLRLRKWVTS